MKSILGLGIFLSVVCGFGTAWAGDTTVSVAGGLVTVPDLLTEVVGFNIRGDVGFEVLPGLYLGGHGEFARMESPTNHHEEYVLFGMGPTLQMSHYPTTWLEPYALVRASIIYYEIYTEGRDVEDNLSVGWNAEVGAMLRSGIFRGGLYYTIGGFRKLLYLPGVRLGLEF